MPYEFGSIYYLPDTLRFREQIAFRKSRIFPGLGVRGIRPVYSAADIY